MAFTGSVHLRLTTEGEKRWEACKQETDAVIGAGRTIPYPHDIETLYRFARVVFPDSGDVDVPTALSNMYTGSDGLEFRDSEICSVLGAAVVLASKGIQDFPLSIDLLSKVLLLHEEDNLKPLMVQLLLKPSSELKDTLVDKRKGYTALHMAAACGNEDVVNLLLPGRNNKYELLQRKTSDGCTALHLCSSEGHVEIVKILMNAYLEFHKAKEEDEKLPDIVKDFFSDKHGSSPLHYAVWNCQSEVVKQLLNMDLTEGVITDLLSKDCFKLTPLHVVSLLHVFLLDPKKTEDFWTADHHRRQLLENLTKYEGKPVQIRDIAGTLLKFAKSHKPTECSMIPLDQRSYSPDHWSVPNDCINCLDRCKYTPLHWAVRFDATELVKLFLDEEKDRIDLFALDVDGKTPLHVAVEHDHTGSYNVLMSDSKVRAAMLRLHRRRAVCVESTNTILIGASLISSLTFAAYLQPPLGWVPYYKEKLFSDTPPGPSDYRLFAAVGLDPAVRAFWILDCLAFFSSIATVLASTQSVMRRHRVHLKDDVKRSEKWVHLVSVLFQLSVLSIIGAFGAVGFAALPNNFRTRKYFGLPFGVLGSLLLCSFVVAAVRWGWAFTGERDENFKGLFDIVHNVKSGNSGDRMRTIEIVDDSNKLYRCEKDKCKSHGAWKSCHDGRQAAILRGFLSVKEVEKVRKFDHQLPRVRKPGTTGQTTLSN